MENPQPSRPTRFLMLVVATALILALSACGDDNGDEPEDPTTDDSTTLTVTELLASQPEGEVVLEGLLFDDGSGLRMCGALAESFPPQCPGEAVPISNPDAVTADFTSSGGVRWTDQVATLSGVLIDGSFEVR